MRRPKSYPVKGIPGWTRTFWPVLFWHACGSCEFEFRNEYMWYQRRRMKGDIGDSNFWYWQCETCHERTKAVSKYRAGLKYFRR